MTAMAAPPAFSPVRELPNGDLFYSPRGLYEFQADDLAETMLRTESDGADGVVVAWDTGLGKTVFSLCLAALLYEAGEIDQVMILCEQNKVRDWVRDIERFTALSALRYHDAGRHNRLARHGWPHILVTTHETGKLDLMRRVKTPGKAGRGGRTDGPLMEHLRGKRVLWVLDEPKMRSRSAEIYQALTYALKELRKISHQRVIALTATPYETSTEDAFNLARFVAPSQFPETIKYWEDLLTNERGRDQFNNLMFSRKQVETHFNPLFQSICLRKRKTDPDVIDQFPKKVEMAVNVTMAVDHRRFYETVQGLFDPPKGEKDERTDDEIFRDEMRLRPALRATAGHPAAHLHLDNEVSRIIVEHVGEDGLRAITSSKTIELLARLKPLIKGQGAQAIIFAGRTSVCVEVVRDLRAAGYKVGEYHGRVSPGVREQAKRDFEDGRIEILFASDMAARGLDFPGVQYAIEYDAASTFALREQRLNRVHRIGAGIPSVTCYTYVLEGTVEVTTIDTMLDRNQAQDDLLGDTEDETQFMSAKVRREIVQAARNRRKK